MCIFKTVPYAEPANKEYDDDDTSDEKDRLNLVFVNTVIYCIPLKIVKFTFLEKFCIIEVRQN